MAERKLIGRGGMSVAPGQERVLGYWPNNLDPNAAPNGWVAKTHHAYNEMLKIAQPLHEMNVAIALAKQTARALPEMPEPQVREKRARENLKRLEKIQGDLLKVQDEAFKKFHSLKPFELDQSAAAELSRQELRNFMRGMSPEQRREALRKHSYKSAAATQEAEISGLTETQRQALIDETLRARFPNELAGIEEAKQALDVAATVMETTRIALENEIKASGAPVVEAPPPQPGKPWIED